MDLFGGGEMEKDGLFTECCSKKLLILTMVFGCLVEFSTTGAEGIVRLFDRATVLVEEVEEPILGIGLRVVELDRLFGIERNEFEVDVDGIKFLAGIKEGGGMCELLIALSFSLIL